MTNEGFKFEKKMEISKDYIKETYEKDHYVEAIILIHYIIEVFMNMTFDTVNSIHDPISRVNKLSKKKMYVISTYRFRNIRDILFDMGIYDKKLSDRLEDFNSGRNIVAHRLFEKLPDKSEVDRYFKLGMELWDEVWKIEENYIKKQDEQMRKLMEETKKK